jgi:superfamily II DNA helicase RecQ
MLLGSAGELPPALATLSTFGLLRHETADSLGDWIRASVSAGLIAVSQDQYRTLSLTEQGRAFLAGRSQDAAIRRPARIPRWSRFNRARDHGSQVLTAFPRHGPRGFRLRG